MIKGKKGDMEQTIYFVIFEIILVAITAIALFNYTNNLAKSTSFEREAMSRDLALLIDTIYMAPGNLHYTYDNNYTTFDFRVIFGNSIVEVSEEGKPITPFFYYGANPNIKMDAYQQTSKDVFSFSKSDNEIKLNSEFNKDLFYCPYVNTTKKDWSIVLDTDFSYGIQRAQKITGTPNQKKETIKDKQNEIISFYMGDEESTQNPLKIYILSDSNQIAKSRKLACKIANWLMQGAKTKFTSTEIIPTYESKDESDQKYILTKDKAQVFVEAGNINFPYEDLDAEKSRYFLILNNALRDYFGETEPGELCSADHCFKITWGVCSVYGGEANYKCPQGYKCCKNTKNDCELLGGRCIDNTKEECKGETIPNKCPSNLKCCKQK